jgi:putative addiction module component (TIGR02574 family)
MASTLEEPFMTTREQIAQQALALPPEDRTFLADVLEQSLISGAFGAPGLAAEWSVEIDRRIAAYDRGESHGADAQIALERIRARLEEHRSSKVTS